MTTRTRKPDRFILARPEGMSDGRWERVQAMAHKVVTGHAPWCTNHEGDEEDPHSYCTHTERAWCADAVLNTGTLGGGTMIGLYVDEGVSLDSLSVKQASAIAGALEQASIAGRHAAINDAGHA